MRRDETGETVDETPCRNCNGEMLERGHTHEQLDRLVEAGLLEEDDSYPEIYVTIN